MSKQDGICSYCRFPAPEPIEHCFDAIACSKDCETALDWMLDGVDLVEIYTKFPQGTEKERSLRLPVKKLDTPT